MILDYGPNMSSFLGILSYVTIVLQYDISVFKSMDHDSLKHNITGLNSDFSHKRLSA